MARVYSEIMQTRSRRMNKLPEDQKLWAEFRRDFENFVVKDIQKSLDAEIEVGVIILTVVGIDCLGGYYAGDESKKEYFVRFTQTFMPSSYAIYAGDIYHCVRNGLVHAYVLNWKRSGRSFLLTRNQGEPHLIPVPNNPEVIYLNRETFARDFLVAQLKYFEQIESDQAMWDNAMQRLRSMGFLTVAPEDEIAARLRGTVSSTPPGSSQNISTGVRKPRP
jgi:hypothetical protein